MSVGRIGLENLKNRSSEFCWCSSFKVLKDHAHDPSQMKKLDRNRTKQIYRVKKELKKHKFKSDRPPKKPFQTPEYYGSPFSYHDQFMSFREEYSD